MNQLNALSNRVEYYEVGQKQRVEFSGAAGAQHANCPALSVMPRLCQICVKIQ